MFESDQSRNPSATDSEINNNNKDNNYTDDTYFIVDDNESDTNSTRDMGRQNTRSENEQDGRKTFFNIVFADKVNQTAKERLLTEVEVVVYVFDCGNELQTGDDICYSRRDREAVQNSERLAQTYTA